MFDPRNGAPVNTRTRNGEPASARRVDANA
jgi:hypothetical protein